MKTQEITEKLIALFGCETDAGLARALGCERQSILRYKQRVTTDLQTTMIELLLKKIEELEKKA
jgi:hypothetical protein